MLKEFKEFAVKGNVVDMAVGIIVGGAFTTVVKSVVDDLVMPPVSLLTGGLDFTNKFVVLREGAGSPPPYNTLGQAEAAGATVLAYGTFINAVVAFIIVAMALFIVIRWINRLRRPETADAPATKSCSFCKEPIHLEATRCPRCTSELAGSAAA